MTIYTMEDVSISRLGHELLEAAKTGSCEDVRELLKRGASFTCNKMRMTALHLASQRGDADIVRVLLDSGSSPVCQSKTGHTPLHLAAQQGHPEVTRLLAGHVATDINVQDMGISEFRQACPQKDYNYVGFVMGMTALHWSVSRGHLEVTELLLQHGANRLISNKFRQTALEIAKASGRQDLIDLLQKSFKVDRPKITIDTLRQLNCRKVTNVGKKSSGNIVTENSKSAIEIETLQRVGSINNVNKDTQPTTSSETVYSHSSYDVGLLSVNLYDISKTNMCSEAKTSILETVVNEGLDAHDSHNGMLSTHPVQQSETLCRPNREEIVCQHSKSCMVDQKHQSNCDRLVKHALNDSSYLLRPEEISNRSFNEGKTFSGCNYLEPHLDISDSVNTSQANSEINNAAIGQSGKSDGSDLTNRKRARDHVTEVEDEIPEKKTEDSDYPEAPPSPLPFIGFSHMIGRSIPASDSDWSSSDLFHWLGTYGMSLVSGEGTSGPGVDTGSLISRALAGGCTVVLTEAGRMIMKDIRRNRRRAAANCYDDNDDDDDDFDDDDDDDDGDYEIELIPAVQPT